MVFFASLSTIVHVVAAGNASSPQDWVGMMERTGIVEEAHNWNDVARIQNFRNFQIHRLSPRRGAIPLPLPAVHVPVNTSTPTTACKEASRLLPAPRQCAEMVPYRFPRCPALPRAALAEINTCNLFKPYVTIGTVCYKRDCTAVVVRPSFTGVVPYSSSAAEASSSPAITGRGPAVGLTFEDFLRIKNPNELHHMNSSGHWMPTVEQLLGLAVEAPESNASASDPGGATCRPPAAPSAPSRAAVPKCKACARGTFAFANSTATRRSTWTTVRYGLSFQGVGPLHKPQQAAAAAQGGRAGASSGASTALTAQSSSCGLPVPSRHAVLAPLSATPKRTVSSFAAWSASAWSATASAAQGQGQEHAYSNTTQPAAAAVAVSTAAGRGRPGRRAGVARRMAVPSRHAVLAQMSSTPTRVVSAFAPRPIANANASTAPVECERCDCGAFAVPTPTRGMGMARWRLAFNSSSDSAALNF